MEPSSSPKLPHNPASDGFAAKAWECLRRNKEFRKREEGEWKLDSVLTRSWDGAEKTPGLPPLPKHWLEFIESRPVNHFASCVIDLQFNPLIDRIPGQRGLIARAGAELHKPWPYLLKKEQEYLKNVLWTGLPRELRTPELIRSVDMWKQVSCTHIIVEIPRDILNKKHRKLVLCSLESMVSKELTAPFSEKPGGRMLGTERLWRAYLLFESWLQRGCDRDLAMRLTAYLMYGTAEAKIALGNAVDPKAAQAFLQRFKLHHNHHSTVEKFIDGIERAIESVYPKFCPIEVNA